jgi:hypothetical protein
LVTIHVSKDIACNTVENPKEECKALKEKEIVRQRDEEELLQFKKWFEKLGMTLEEGYDKFMGELVEYRCQESLVAEVRDNAEPKLPPKKKDP